MLCALSAARPSNYPHRVGEGCASELCQSGGVWKICELRLERGAVPGEAAAGALDGRVAAEEGAHLRRAEAMEGGRREGGRRCA